MPDFLTLACPTCGGKLQITPDIERFACAHCGNEHLVRRGTGVVTLAPVVESMDGLRRATDRTASEMAIRRIQDELAGPDPSRAEIEGRLAGARSKLAEHDKRHQEIRSLPWPFLVGLVAALVYLGVRSYLRTHEDPFGLIRLFVGFVSLSLAIAGPLGGIAAAIRLATAPALQPPRETVVASIQAAEHDLEAHAAARLAKQAELAQHLRRVSTSD